MKCLECGSENLKAKVTITYDLPMAQRMGTIKIGGFKVTQLDLKAEWDKRAVRGPINCWDCGAEHVYIVGDREPLRLGGVEDFSAAEADDAGVAATG